MKISIQYNARNYTMHYLQITNDNWFSDFELLKRDIQKSIREAAYEKPV